MHLLPVLIPLVATFIGMVGAILSALGFARPGRMPRPRRLLNYRVHYDDSLGTRPDMKGVAELVVRRKGQDVPDASLAMIRISNEGGLDIGKEHWVMPINFTFDGRDVVGVEVSDSGRVPPGLLTGDQERARLDGDGDGGDGRAGSQTIQISKGKKALELPRVELKRKDKIRLLVLLSGPRDRLRPGVEGDAYIKGAGRGGGLVREFTPRRVADLHIDIVSRTTDSGTRATFDRRILHLATETPQSSTTCTSPDLISGDPVIRCEKSSTGQLLEAVNAIPGAIGYAEAAAAAAPGYSSVDEIQLDGRSASPELVKNGQYPFWAVETLYSYGTPAPGSLLSAFLGYMSTDTAASILQNDGDIPCGLTTLCAA